jgi:hypothetical protein
MRGFGFAIGIVMAGVLADGAHSQAFTTQEEVQPILEMTRAHWVGIGTATGRDLLYFTHVLSWRCGFEAIRYGLNGAEPETELRMEPCHRESNAPNAIRELPFVSYGLNSIESVTVELVFADGQILRESFSRSAIRID